MNCEVCGQYATYCVPVLRPLRAAAPLPALDGMTWKAVGGYDEHWACADRTHQHLIALRHRPRDEDADGRSVYPMSAEQAHRWEKRTRLARWRLREQLAED